MSKSNAEHRQSVAVALTEMQQAEKQAYFDRRNTEVATLLFDQAQRASKELWDEKGKYIGQLPISMRDVGFAARVANEITRGSSGNNGHDLSKQSGEDLSRAVEAMARSNAVLSAAIAHAYLERHHPQDIVDITPEPMIEGEKPLDST